MFLNCRALETSITAQKIVALLQQSFRATNERLYAAKIFMVAAFWKIYENFLSHL
jgi:hypothetical protein